MQVSVKEENPVSKIGGIQIRGPRYLTIVYLGEIDYSVTNFYIAPGPDEAVRIFFTRLSIYLAISY